MAERPNQRLIQTPLVVTSLRPERLAVAASLQPRPAEVKLVELAERAEAILTRPTSDPSAAPLSSADRRRG